LNAANSSKDPKEENTGKFHNSVEIGFSSLNPTGKSSLQEIKQLEVSQEITENKQAKLKIVDNEPKTYSRL